MGWNITASGARPFHQGQICNYVGGMIPFAKTAQERQSNSDPRPSLEERYVNHEGYIEAVKKATTRAIRAGFLLGGFKFEAQRALKIDGTPLKVF